MRIMVAVLDWGLGHASRSMPLIDQLDKDGHEVFVASSGTAATLLSQVFPQHQHLSLDPYNITYSKSGSQSGTILMQTPRILQTIRKEHHQLQKYHAQYEFDKAIADHRYGCWLEGVESIFLAHQLALLPPKALTWGRKMLFDWHMSWLGKFSQIWIPDVEGENSLSGSLSQAYELPPQVSFVGPLSRFLGFKTKEKLAQGDKFPEIVAVVSGPEPQRSLFEDRLKELLLASGKKSWIIRGKPDLKKVEKWDQLFMFPHLEDQQMAQALSQARLVISRSGYTSIMDYAALGLENVLLVPTPGQSEQEYLGRELSRKKFAWTLSQNNLSLNQMQEIMSEPRGFPRVRENDLLQKKLEAWK